MKGDTIMKTFKKILLTLLVLGIIGLCLIVGGFASLIAWIF